MADAKLLDSNQVPGRSASEIEGGKGVSKARLVVLLLD